MSTNNNLQNNQQNNLYERTTTIGSWDYDTNGNIVWKKSTVKKTFNLALHEWISSPEIIELETPKSQGLKKEISTCFIFKKEIPDIEEFGSVKTLLYCQKVSFKVNNNQGENIWLRESQGKVYLLSINPDNPQCIEAPHSSTENVTFKLLSKPLKITPKHAQEIIKETGTKYIYGRVLGTGDNIEYLTVISAV